MEHAEWPGVYRSGRDLFTRNATPGVRVYGEELRAEGTAEYRMWDPFRSKLAAYLLRGAPAGLLADVRSVLYLGGAHGTTVSHLAELLPDARIFVIEKSPTSFAPLLALARRRANLLPILADAQLPERYAADVGIVDFLYQDIAQRAQAGIFFENAQACLATRGRGLLMLKVRSVTQRRTASAIVHESRSILERGGWRVDGGVALTPFSKEHVALRVDR
ncbi:MAG: fibrillarin-like rRNA/tRNA 2'-O-methyltransferase [Thermoplasmata archaeon]